MQAQKPVAGQRFIRSSFSTSIPQPWLTPVVRGFGSEDIRQAKPGSSPGNEPRRRPAGITMAQADSSGEICRQLLSSPEL
ncbi:hypothetical protein ElyMa_006646600 [Elysia marginata]|uniref:Uncharacterized protein n=1 Tax=Elysia marginata TaxID=1093978 RepID=A0AAV4IKP0_9GAST|nr:hypothetical protein ElyMa_006646600 [Elysia marginata]